MPFRDPRMISALLFAAGLGMAMWYGVAWYEIPAWSQAEIEQSVELNLAMDLSRRGALRQPDVEALARLRAQVRAEVEAEIDRERRAVQAPFAIGLLLSVATFGHLLAGALAARRAG